MNIPKSAWMILFMACFAGCSSPTASKGASFSRRYHVSRARIAESADGQDGMRMYKGGSKTAACVVDAKVTKKVEAPASLPQKGEVEKLDPSKEGAGKLSMQDYNRYAYRQSNASEAGIPVTAAGDESEKNVKK